MAKKETVNSSKVWFGLAVTRLALGFIFFWAFIDKLWGLGFATKAAKSWVNGGSPTTGFLKGAEGPFASFFNGLAGSPVADWLFMIGLLGIGTALLVGAGVRLAAWAGALLMALMWAASLPMTTNPVLDDHIIYALILLTIGWALPNLKLGLATSWWQSLGFVKKNPWLK
jgi:thiosulfate dehydrogenase [quinone] large subunit